jgi:hypothetical protein
MTIGLMILKNLRQELAELLEEEDKVDPLEAYLCIAAGPTQDL